MINILSKETIDKIAAGEVAERPESVVKELLDNAIDSGADTISIEVRGGGLTLIRVTDNGSGIEKADVRNAFLRHATSKLKTADDIEHIRSMGFRGEALASIAAVSEVELITRNVNELTGTQYRIEGGAERSFKEIGVPQGTTVIVRNFLMNVPVRRQFLKSAQTETAYIVNTVEKLALAYTNIAFSLNVDGKNTFSSTGNGKLRDVIYQIYGREAAASLLEVDTDKTGEAAETKVQAVAAESASMAVAAEKASGAAAQNKASGAAAQNKASEAAAQDTACDNAEADETQTRNNGSSLIHVHGYAARPVIARSRRDYEVFFVNGRWIQSDILRKAAEDAYAPYMMQHKYPMIILHIDLAPEGVDVNVHPRKQEVRFSSNKLIYDAVYDVLTRVLHDAELIVDAGNAYFLKDKKQNTASVAGRAPEAFERNRQYDYVSSITEEIAKNSRKDGDYINGEETIKPGTETVISGTERVMSGTETVKFGREIEISDTDAEKSGAASQNEINYGSVECTDNAAAKDINKHKFTDGSNGNTGRAHAADAFMVNDAVRMHDEKNRNTAYDADNTDNSEVYGGIGQTAAASGQKLNGSISSKQEKAADGKVFINKNNMPYFKMVGQVFETYWIIEYNDEMYIIDQHAAHEKVNFEHFMALIRSHAVETQMIFPPIVLTLGAKEAVLFDKFIDEFAGLGYDIEYAGDRDYIVRGVPSNLPQLADEEVLRSLIDSLFDEARGLNSELIHDKIASMSCKAAIKGNMKISETEMRGLIAKLLTLENPYACPHGRPTIIKWSRSDLDKLFKRIVS